VLDEDVFGTSRIHQGANLTAEEFVSSALAEGIEVLEAPMESQATITHMERYHGPLRIAYSRIRQELSTCAV
jgi:hypothetical protein